MFRCSILIICLLATGCSGGKPNSETGNSIAPEPIAYPEYEKYDLYGAGCAFAADGGGMGAIALTQAKRAFVKLNGSIIRFDSDPNSAKMPAGTFEKYIGDSYRMSVGFEDGKATPALKWRGVLTIGDGQGRTVFTSAGDVQCST